MQATRRLHPSAGAALGTPVLHHSAGTALWTPVLHPSAGAALWTPVLHPSAGAALGTPVRMLQPADLIVLVVVVGFVVPAASDLLRVRDPRTIVVLAICWACAALKRLMAWRNGRQRPLLQDGRVEVAASGIIFAGVAPWIVLPLLERYYPHASLWAPLSLPAWLRAGGAVLMLCGVMRPFLAALRSGRSNIATVTMRPAAVRSVTPGMFLDGLGFGLFAASPLLGVLMATWLALACRVNHVRRGPLRA